ncbi:hypothetical protein DPMN_062329 [Dreissena polymorpha]|uniref:PHD-type domain-containing protein n=1 Tax=Dreissena polymorpha TaxID=45954 RepID=A0A9D4HI20_DREPO|nr:hypothetical protein DPMN_062329 [Dreissena polymorpha]
MDAVLTGQHFRDLMGIRKVREENIRKKQEAKRLKELAKSQSKKQTLLSSSSDSDRDVAFADSDDDDLMEEKQCPGCGTEDGDQNEWVTCTKCPRNWHITCTGDAILFELPFEQIPNYPFICESCM